MNIICHCQRLIPAIVTSHSHQNVVDKVKSIITCLYITTNLLQKYLKLTIKQFIIQQTDDLTHISCGRVLFQTHNQSVVNCFTHSKALALSVITDVLLSSSPSRSPADMRNSPICSITERSGKKVPSINFQSDLLIVSIIFASISNYQEYSTHVTTESSRKAICSQHWQTFRKVCTLMGDITSSRSISDTTC